MTATQLDLTGEKVPSFLAVLPVCICGGDDQLANDIRLQLKMFWKEGGDQ